MQPFNPAASPAQKKVLALLRAADRDTEAAESLIQHSPHLHEGIGFNCQQAAEKYLKAALLTYSLPAPFIHDLTSLATDLSAQVVSTTTMYQRLPFSTHLQLSGVMKATTRPTLP